MTYKDQDEQRRYKRLYMRRYRRVLRDSGIAKLGKIRDLVSHWEADLEKRKESSSRVILARRLLDELRQILEK